MRSFCFLIFLLCVVYTFAALNPCLTPLNQNGHCQPYKSCKSLFNIGKNKPSAKDIKFLKDSRCKTSKEIWVCCPDDNEDRIENCKTPEGTAGTCGVIEECPEYLDKSEHFTATICSVKNNKTLICCPENARNSVNTKKTAIKTTSRPLISINSEEFCKTPNNLDGTCVAFLKCPHIMELYSGTNVSQENADFITKSICGEKDGNTLVCCSSPLLPTTLRPFKKVQSTTRRRSKATTTTTEQPFKVNYQGNVKIAWLEKLKSLVPKAPNCGTDAFDKIIGAKSVGISDHTWMALLEYTKPDGSKSFKCGGSLINERYVLSAAHCVLKTRSIGNLTGVRIGEHRISSVKDCNPDDPHHCNPPVIDIEVVDVKTYKDYRSQSVGQHFDIALLRLAESLESQDFKPICLPLDQSLWNINDPSYSFDVVGWGRTEKGVMSDVKLKATLPLKRIEDCKVIYARGGRRIIDSQICAGGEKGVDSCNGDSGGPLMRYEENAEVPHWVLIGIVSYGAQECGTEGIPGVYTRVSSFLEWLSQNIEK